MTDAEIEKLAMTLQAHTAAGRLPLNEVRTILRKLEELGFAYKAPKAND